MDVNVLKNLKEIRTPLAFLSLVIIATEGLLYSLIGKADGADLTVLTISMALLPFACLGIFYFLFKDRIPGYEGGGGIIDKHMKPKSIEEYNLFVSTPMAAFDSSKEFEKHRAAILDVLRGIKRRCDFDKVFYAGSEISSFEEFELADLSVAEDYNALKYSDNFMIIYPKRITTSALIELGWAMAMGKPIVVFARNRDDLPYLMKHADSVYKNIAIYIYTTSSDIRNIFDRHGIKIFEARR